MAKMDDRRDACLAEKDYLPIITQKVSLCLDLSEVLTIERNGRIIHVTTFEEDFYFYGKMESVMCYLNNDFYACLQGLIINFRNVRCFQMGVVEFINGHVITVGKKSYGRARQAYNSYLLNQRNLMEG